MGNLEDLIANVGVTLGRPLTDEETNQIIVWEKCRDLSHFVEGFPNEWKLMKEMAYTSIKDVQAQWNEFLLRDPSPDVDIKVAHAKAVGACNAIANFVASVENAPQLAREVPEVLKTSIEVMRAAPQEV